MKVDLEIVSLLRVSGLSQRCYVNQIVKTAKPVSLRIELTFRLMQVSQAVARFVRRAAV